MCVCAARCGRLRASVRRTQLRWVLAAEEYILSYTRKMGPFSRFKWACCLFFLPALSHIFRAACSPTPNTPRPRHSSRCYRTGQLYKYEVSHVLLPSRHRTDASAAATLALNPLPPPPTRSWSWIGSTGAQAARAHRRYRCRTGAGGTEQFLRTRDRTATTRATLPARLPRCRRRRRRLWRREHPPRRLRRSRARRRPRQDRPAGEACLYRREAGTRRTAAVAAALALPGVGTSSWRRREERMEA